MLATVWWQFDVKLELVIFLKAELHLKVFMVNFGWKVGYVGSPAYGYMSLPGTSLGSLILPISGSYEPILDIMLQVPIAAGSVSTTCVKTRYEHLA